MLTSSSEVSFNVGKLLWGLFWMLIITAVSYIFFPKKMLTPTEQISHLHGRILELRADIDAGKSRIAQIKGLESEFMELIRKHERLRSQSKIINADINELHDSNDQIRDQFVEYQKAYCDAICKQAIGEKWPNIKVGKIGRREFVEIIHLDRDELFYSYELPNVAGARINAKASTEQLSEKLQHRFQFELSDELKALLDIEEPQVIGGVPRQLMPANFNPLRELALLKQRMQAVHLKRRNEQGNIQRLEGEYNRLLKEIDRCICRHHGVMQRNNGLQPAVGLQVAGGVDGAGVDNQVFRLRFKIIEIENKIDRGRRKIWDLDREIRHLERRLKNLPQQAQVGRQLKHNQAGLHVISASYGADGIFNDVTRLVRDKVKRGDLHFSANSGELGGDPIFGKVKQFDILYNHGGVEYFKSYREGSWVSLP